MEAKEIWWAILLDGGNAEEGFFYYSNQNQAPKLLETKRMATRFAKSIGGGTPVQVTITAE